MSRKSTTYDGSAAGWFSLEFTDGGLFDSSLASPVGSQQPEQPNDDPAADWEYLQAHSKYGVKLPFWLDGRELGKLARAAENWWGLVESWVRWPLGQMDAATCTLDILDMLAFQRDIQRFKDEPESLYRNRVKYALANAQDAGSKAGFIRIFQRLGIGYVEITERFDLINWDVIKLRLTDSQIAGNQELLMNIVMKYGRTCRRYEFDTLTAVPIEMPIWGVGHSWGYSVASL